MLPSRQAENVTREPIDLVVLAVKDRAVRCRLLDGEQVITLRAGGLHRIVAGQIATVRPNKEWRLAGRPYMSGEIVASRIDTAALDHERAMTSSLKARRRGSRLTQ